MLSTLQSWPAGNCEPTPSTSSQASLHNGNLKSVGFGISDAL
jgi:hypothetical protein